MSLMRGTGTTCHWTPYNAPAGLRVILAPLQACQDGPTAPYLNTTSPIMDGGFRSSPNCPLIQILKETAQLLQQLIFKEQQTDILLSSNKTNKLPSHRIYFPTTSKEVWQEKQVSNKIV